MIAPKYRSCDVKLVGLYYYSSTLPLISPSPKMHPWHGFNYNFQKKSINVQGGSAKMYWNKVCYIVIILFVVLNVCNISSTSLLLLHSKQEEDQAHSLILKGRTC